MWIDGEKISELFRSPKKTETTIWFAKRWSSIGTLMSWQFVGKEDAVIYIYIYIYEKIVHPKQGWYFYSRSPVEKGWFGDICEGGFYEECFGTICWSTGKIDYWKRDLSLCSIIFSMTWVQVCVMQWVASFTVSKVVQNAAGTLNII